MHSFGTRRSDFPNQINNSLGFQGIFRGTLDMRARATTDEMFLAAVEELAHCAEDRAIHEDHVPTMDEWEIFREAVAVAMKAQEQGVARLRLTRAQLHAKASAAIKGARDQAQLPADEALIAPIPQGMDRG